MTHALVLFFFSAAEHKTELTRLSLSLVHVPSWFRNNHLSSPFVKFTPQILRVQRDFRLIRRPFLRLQALRGPRRVMLRAPESCVQPRVAAPWQRLGQGGEVRQSQPGEERRLSGGEEGWQGQGGRSVSLERLVSHGSRCVNWISHRDIRSDGSILRSRGARASPSKPQLSWRVLKHGKEIWKEGVQIPASLLARMVLDEERPSTESAAAPRSVRTATGREMLFTQSVLSGTCHTNEPNFIEATSPCTRERWAWFQAGVLMWQRA